MSFLNTIRDLLKPPAVSKTSGEFSLPYNLTAGEWTALKRLTSHEGYPVLLKTLDATVKLRGEMILQTSSDSTLHFLRGFVSGLRKAGTIIEEIKQDEARYAKQKEALTNVRKPERSTALYGSPGWRPTSK